LSSLNIEIQLYENYHFFRSFFSVNYIFQGSCNVYFDVHWTIAECLKPIENVSFLVLFAFMRLFLILHNSKLQLKGKNSRSEE